MLSTSANQLIISAVNTGHDVRNYLLKPASPVRGGSSTPKAKRKAQRFARRQQR